MIRLTQVVILVMCLCHGMALAQSESMDAPPADVPAMTSLFPLSYTQMDEIRKDFGLPAKKNFSLDLWPKLVEIKGFYLEKRQDLSAPAADSANPKGGYFNLLATSAGFGGKLVGEGEFAYSALGLNALDQHPIMSRFGLRGAWGKTNYGLQYRAFGSGFVSMGGLKVDQPRDERQLWGEYDFGLFRLRGNLGESWEGNSLNGDETRTRTAMTMLNVNKPGWSASLSSGYALSGQRAEPAMQTAAFSNGISMAYRPNRFISLEPGLSFKQEWDPLTGFKTETPSWGLALVSTPGQDFQFSTRASYSRALSEDPSKEISTLSTAANFNWKIGKTFLGEQSLSFQLEYKNDIAANALNKPQSRLAGLLQWKIANF